MKKFLALLGLVLVTTVGYSQTNVHTSFFESVTAYFTSFNTNLDTVFTTHKGSLWSGARFNGGAHTGSMLGLNYDIGKFGVESASGFADISGFVESQFLGVGYSAVVHDAKISAFIGGSANFPEDGARTLYRAEIVLEAKKALTEHTFSFIRLSQQIENRKTPSLTLGVGFTF